MRLAGVAAVAAVVFTTVGVVFGTFTRSTQSALVLFAGSATFVVVVIALMRGR